MPLTRAGLMKRISNETGLTQQDTFAVIQKTLEYIIEALEHGEKVVFRDFGTFTTKIRKGFVGNHPYRPGQRIAIPTKRTVRFKAGSGMAERIAKGGEITESQIYTGRIP